VKKIASQTSSAGVPLGHSTNRAVCCNQRVNLERLPTFVDAEVFHVVVESPRGSAVKLKYAGRFEAFTISRPLPIGLTYPFDWGFVPSTKADDGDPVDAAIVWDVATFPGVVIPCRALALIKVEQNRAGTRQRARNDRILAVPVDSRRDKTLESWKQLGDRRRAELELFFLTAAALEGKDPQILGWDDPAAALQLLRSANA
jgi:inorganic pyrophosphatase